MRFRQSTVLVITAAIFGLVSVLLAACVLLTRHQVQSAEATSKRAAEFRQLGIDLGNASDFLTNQARIFSVTGDQRYLTAYWNEINVTKTRDHAIAQLKLLGAPADELALLDKAKHNSDALVNTEARSQRLMEEALGVPEARMPAAIAAFHLSRADEVLGPAAKRDLARTIMFDRTYDHNKGLIMTPVAQFENLMNGRAAAAASSAKHSADVWLEILIAIALFIPTASAAVLLLLHKQVNLPIRGYSRSLADGGDGAASLEPAGTVELRQLARRSTPSRRRAHCRLPRTGP